ncbi:hypothetical protein DLAC_01660 [Tieghemostelium lacteum]|uniref:Uncharacterized protein n=1 Tax=Tieghemostelium lacteum TaxID=361077 RepID=A0A152A608_TIELA|nr:hypothetical protein DLAC_01660 [Tieghemostelium lacteum]|eukprot:KYR01658.1 hypothetical protein DLAC_01660 [Tieghemostelium lacteum]
MVINFIVDKQVEDQLLRKRNEKFEIGLLVGQEYIGEDNNEEYLVLGSIATPKFVDQDKNNQVQIMNSIQDVNIDWTLEHMHQISRMMYGGNIVLGFYLLFPEENAINDNTESHLSTLLKSYIKEYSNATKAIPILLYNQKTLDLKMTNDKFKYKLKSNSFKVQEGLYRDSFQRFKCNLNLGLKLKVEKLGNLSDIKLKLFKDIKDFTESLFKSSIFLIDNQQYNNDLVIKDTFKNDKIVNIDIINEMNDNVVSKDSDQILISQGTIDCQIVVYKKSKISKIISDLKSDIIQTMNNRIDILTDSSNSNELNLQNKTITLPQRVEIQLLPTSLILCDYLLTKETYQDISSRILDLLQLPESSLIDSIKSVENDSVDSLIKSSKSSTSKSTSSTKPINNNNNSTTQPPKTKTNNNNNTNILVAIAIGILLIAYIYSIYSK